MGKGRYADAMLLMGHTSSSVLASLYFCFYIEKGAAVFDIAMLIMMRSSVNLM